MGNLGAIWCAWKPATTTTTTTTRRGFPKRPPTCAYNYIIEQIFTLIVSGSSLSIFSPNNIILNHVLHRNVFNNIVFKKNFLHLISKCRNIFIVVVWWKFIDSKLKQSNITFCRSCYLNRLLIPFQQQFPALFLPPALRSYVKDSKGYYGSVS